VIVAMMVNGILDLQIVRGSVDGETFMDFVHRLLLPNLMPFNGKNPSSDVVLDNCSVNHIEGVVRVNSRNGNSCTLPTTILPRLNSY